MSTIFGSSRVVIYIPPNYVTTDTSQSISGLKTFTGLLTCDDGIDTNYISFSDNTIQTTAAFSTPTGTISMFGGIDAPTGYVLCDGAYYNSSNPLYGPLFEVIGTLYTQAPYNPPFFRVPDFRGVYPGMPGTNTQAALQDANLATGTFVGPVAVGLYQYQSLPFISHTHTSDYPRDTNRSAVVGDKSYYESGAAQQNETSVAQNAIAPNTYTVIGNNVRPVSLGINYIIKL